MIEPNEIKAKAERLKEQNLDCKPDVCAGFPYTDRPGRLSSLYGVIEHADVCTVVFEILERLKAIYRFRTGYDFSKGE
ncbi:MAG: hypothetical protein FWG96_04840 [Methanomassiliicoccaceae archaeon]|nr:hypothetical protein [Methanomassiliicoccaceae archaeon]